MILPFGESALLVELDDDRQAQALAASLAAAPIPGMVEAVPGLSSLLVEFDPAVVTDPAAQLARHLESLRPVAVEGRRRCIPVVYGGEHGPDLGSVAELCGLTESEVVELHGAADLRVLFNGFAPGFAYLGHLPEGLDVPRLATPRTRTPAGSVAIAERMTGIYPSELPGGWPVIGRTPVTLFDAQRQPPAYLAPGDVVSFEPIEAGAWDSRAGAPDDWT